ncbi:MAG: bacteriohemerythrin [Desulfovibrionaceae bacterium]|jgi:hemerythrin|nr:bacteriohemerythrin [Desulfovibrionaceae bacterium]
MAALRKFQVTRGVYYIEAPDAGLNILCGCPSDSVKHLMKKGLILPTDAEGVRFETGPNAILLSDVQLQGGVFANLAEFPVLQMLYRQGMILPGHPNNTGAKPILIGSESQVRAQMEYIHRGNYGLLDVDEIMAAGVEREQAEEMMRLKLRFAFGAIRDTGELLDARVVGKEPVEIRNGLFIQRLALNVFEFNYDDASVTVDLNLPPGTGYEAPYLLGYSDIDREYFAVVHSGEGDGWDVNRPCMAAVLMFQGRIYLIDAGPNILYSLNTLGIGVNEIEGIFHTHAHDDHFNGLTTLMRSDHRLKYFATPLVRSSVTKKLSALAAIDEADFAQYFEIHDLVEGVWNDLESLEVMPVNSPHPVETTVMLFRALGGEGYRTYAHFADIVSLDVLRGFVTDDPLAPGISEAFYEGTRESYLRPADLKKLDIGGGLIHGNAEDFKDDPSDKIILSHTALPLTNRQKEIGSGAPFGMVDVLIPAYQDYLRRYAFHYLSAYFPDVPKDHILALTNNPVQTYNPESILLKVGTVNSDVYLVLTGVVERIETESDLHGTLSAGAIVGEFSGLIGAPSMETYRAVNFVRVLCIPGTLYSRFIKRNHLFGSIERLQDNRDFLMKTYLFGDGVSFPVLNRMAANMTETAVAEGEICGAAGGVENEPNVCLVRRGLLHCVVDDRVVDIVPPGDFAGGSVALYSTPCPFSVVAREPSILCRLDVGLLQDIPVVRWKLFETHKRRTELALSPEQSGGGFFQWRPDHDVGVEMMDNDHRRMFEIAAGLHKAIKQGATRPAKLNILNALIRYSQEHFFREEDLMAETGYAEAAEHAERHRRLMERVREHLARIESGEMEMETEFISVLKDWLINHILTEDRKLGETLHSRGA